MGTLLLLFFRKLVVLLLLQEFLPLRARSIPAFKVMVELQQLPQAPIRRSFTIPCPQNQPIHSLLHHVVGRDEVYLILLQLVHAYHYIKHSFHISIIVSFCR